MNGRSPVRRRVVHIVADFEVSEGIGRATLEVAAGGSGDAVICTNRVVSGTDRVKVCEVGGSAATFSLSRRREIRGLIRRLDPDVVHVHGGVLAPIWARPMRVGRPLVLSVYGWPRLPSAATVLRNWREVRTSAVLRPRVLLSGLLPSWLLRRAVRASGAGAVLSTDERVVSALAGSGVRAGHLPVGTPLSSQRAVFDSNTPLLVLAGRAETARGVDTAIEAMAHVVKAFPLARLRLLLLPSPQLPDIEQLVSRAAPGVIEIVTNPLGDLQAEFAKATVALFPFKYDNTTSLPPLTVLEAMAVGLPVVTTGVACLRSIVDPGRNALVVQHGDAKALAGAVVSLLRDRTRWEGLAGEAVDTVRSSWTWASAVEATEAAHRSVAGGKGRAAWVGT